MTLLSVNVDHIATLRQARGLDYPDPVQAARLAEEAGAAGITVHLRADRRHIQTHDVSRLRAQVRGKLNLEMAATREMFDIALEIRPDQVTLVPERPEEVTTEGGLNLVRDRSRIERISENLTDEGIAVSLFLDPDMAQLDALGEMRPGHVVGFEINTDAYTRAKSGEVDARIEKIVAIAGEGATRDYEIYAGHGLTVANVGPVAATPEIGELNIGHSIVSRAALIGMAAAVGEMLEAIEAAQPRMAEG
jgi:pyridoxine 5-phosphate synthase